MKLRGKKEAKEMEAKKKQRNEITKNKPKNVTNKMENESETRQKANERAETQKSEGDGLGFNSINSSESDSHVIIKDLPNFSLTSAKRRGERERDR